MAVRVKICGITNLDDALAAVEAGADALGFVFAPSPRRVTPKQAAAIIQKLPPFVTAVGVVVDQDVGAILAECQLHAVQFHGAEPPETLARTKGIHRIKAFRIRDAADLAALRSYRGVADAYLLDTYAEESAGGTGKTFAWKLATNARAAGLPVIIAGGLTPENVAEAIRQARPYAVDVSSGVESAPGRKDREKLRRFIAAARGR